MSEQSSREELLVKILNQAQALSAGIHPAIYRGHSPYIGENGNWYAYDDTLNAVVDTGVCAQGDEAARVAAELERAAAELSRAEGEQQRQAAEAARAGAEALRVQAEQLRAQAEAARGEAEAQRTSGETERAEAEAARVEAEATRTTAENARAEAELLRQAAKADMEAATAALQGMTAEAQTLPPGSAATAALSDVEGCKRLTLGLPEGQPGRSVASILRTAGTGAAGTTDTYTITYSDGATSTFTVYNGADGLGAGDMLAAAYDPDGDGKVEAADHADSANNATHAGSAAALDDDAEVSMDQVSGLESALAGKQPTGNYLTAETDPTVPDWAKAQTKPTYTADEVGARPATWMPTADQVGARPNTWTPTAQDVGARPDTWTPTADQVGASAKPVILTGILTAEGWSGSAAPYTQTLTITGIPASQDAAVFVSIAPTSTAAQMEAWGACMVMATGHGANSLTFSAKGEKPVTDLPIQVTVFE